MTIAGAIYERSKQSIKYADEQRQLWDRVVAADTSTPEGVREVSSCWARSERLWAEVPDIPAPDVPPGGTPVAMRMAA